MSVAGFDIGNATSCVAVARKGGIDVLMNKESKRESPTVVTFGSKTRLLGTDAAPSLSVNPKNTITQLKRLIGRQLSDPQLQADLVRMPFKLVAGPNGQVLVEVLYLDKVATFSPEQLVAMMLVDQKAIAEAETGGPITDCVISVPAYFTEPERYAMLTAAQTAGLTCLRLMSETTAVALAYGIYRTDLPEADPIHVAVIDFSHSSFQVSIVAFKKGQLQVLSHAWDRDLGGRNFDQVLFEHFADEFKAKHGLDVRANNRARHRLMLQCEKLKKVLSANSEAVLSVECLMNDIDYSSSLTRDIFEELAAPLLERIKTPIEKALKLSGLSKEQLYSVEVVGGSMRVPSVLRIINDFFGKEASRTMNAKEAVSKGCALQCAMLSPIFRVREFEVIENFPFAVSVTWDKDGESVTSTLFERGCAVPSAKMLTFHRSQAFSIHAHYSEDSDLPPNFDRRIGTFHVGPIKVPPGQDKVKLKVKMRLNLHGLVAVESVQQIEEEEEVVEAPAPGNAAATDAAPAGGDVAMSEAAGSDAAANGGAATEGGSGGGATPMDTDKKADKVAQQAVKRKRTKKTDVHFTTTSAARTPAQLQDLFEAECELALAAKVQQDTSECKNAVEAYVYFLRNKLSGEFAPFVAEGTAAALSRELDATEDWLYDEGEDQVKSVYVKKLEELKSKGGPIEARYQDSLTREGAAASLKGACAHYTALLTSAEPQYAHLEAAEREQGLAECNKALQWLEDKQGLQRQLKQCEEPVLTTGDIKKKEDTVRRVCEPIVSKQPPPPPQEAGDKGDKMEVDEAAPAGGQSGPTAEQAVPPGGPAQQPTA